MMMETFFRKGSNFPTLHPCGHRRDPIHPSGPVRNITPDILKTLTPEKLARASHIILTFKAVLARIIASVLCERSSGDTQLRIFRKLSHQEFHIARLKGNIGVKVSHYVELNRVYPLESESNGMSLRSKIAIGVLRSANQLDPRMAPRIALDDFCCAVRGTVVHDDPALRQSRLSNHRVKRLSNERLLIPRRGDQHIFHRTEDGSQEVSFLRR